ncbi:MAG: ADP-ribosylglycohydrolase family protein [Candidatus Izemoplasmatales bacterium]
MPGWEPIGQILKKELRQLYEEGLDVRVEDASLYLETMPADKLGMVVDLLRRSKRRRDYPYVEPDDPTGLPAETKDVLPRTKRPSSDAFLGAVLGRMAGCVLGKPLETGPYFWESTKERPGWKNVKRWFEGAGQYPIRDYVPASSDASDLHVVCPKSQKEHLAFVETDDDVRYTLLALERLERHGFAFSDRDVGALWHELLGYRDVCTAETQAYLNFAQVSTHLGGDVGPLSEADASYVRMHMNPYREWIGATIRIDGYAYAAAGDPLLAASLAAREARFSHVKNGVYAPMFFAALIASAFVTDDIDACVAQALDVIPATSRLHEALVRTIAIVQAETDTETMVGRVWERLLDYDPAHAVNNACVCLAAILHGGRDYSKAIGTAALFGLDTDCNAATVGSFVGALVGASAIPDHWKEPLHDTIRSGIRGYDPIAITEVARRFEALYRANAR